MASSASSIRRPISLCLLSNGSLSIFHMSLYTGLTSSSTYIRPWPLLCHNTTLVSSHAVDLHRHTNLGHDVINSLAHDRACGGRTPRSAGVCQPSIIYMSMFRRRPNQLPKNKAGGVEYYFWFTRGRGKVKSGRPTQEIPMVLRLSNGGAL